MPAQGIHGHRKSSCVNVVTGLSNGMDWATTTMECTNAQNNETYRASVIARATNDRTLTLGTGAFSKSS